MGTSTQLCKNLEVPVSAEVAALQLIPIGLVGAQQVHDCLMHA